MIIERKLMAVLILLQGDEEEREAASDANLDLSLGLNSHDTDRRA